MKFDVYDGNIFIDTIEAKNSDKAREIGSDRVEIDFDDTYASEHNSSQLNHELDKKIYDKGYEGFEEPGYHSYTGKEDDVWTIEEDTKGKFVVKEGYYDSEAEDNILEGYGVFSSLEEAKSKAFSIPYIKKSKRKKPISFKRSNVPHTPKSVGSQGPGKGWHKQSLRHSKASIKGWKGRRR